MLRHKFFKILLWCFGGLAALVLGLFAVVYGVSSSHLHRTYSVTVAPIAVPNSAEMIERGRHVVATRACADCHGQDFGGAKVIDDPAAGLLWGANITRGQGGLPADYSDLDYVRAIRHGIARDGRPLMLMPSAEYTHLSDEDLGAVIAYLKTLPAVDRPRGPVKPGPVIRALMALGKIKLSAEEIDHQATHLASISPSITPTYGKYLASSCTGCHGGNMSGGKIAGAPPDWPAAANLTPDPSGRVGQWTEEQFINVLRTKQRPDGSTLSPVMPAAFAQMSDLEIKALWSYLKTLTPAPTGMR